MNPGTSYHLAAVWQNGSQQYYLNGNRVKTDNKTGLIGLLGDNSSHPYRLGSDSNGTDVTLDEPTLWVGYALSGQDVLNLCNRVDPPQGIAPGSIALQWSLAGSGGVATKVGDVGLVDASTTGLNLTSIVGASPTYLAGTLFTTPIALIGSASVAPSGKSISLIFENNGAVANVSAIQSPSDVQTISLAGEPSGMAFSLTFNGQTTSPIPVTPTSPAVNAVWSATVTAGHAYAISSTWYTPFGPVNSEQVLYEIFADPGLTNRLGFATLNQRQDSYYSPGSFPYGTAESGAALYWTPIGTFTPTGTSIYVRMTCPAIGVDSPNNNIMMACGLLLEDTVNSSYQILDPGNSNQLNLGGNWNRFVNNGRSVSGNVCAGSGTGAGTLYPPVLSTMLSSLQALSTIGNENISLVTSNYGTSVIATFTGSLANVCQNPMTCSDPSVSIVHTTPGGSAPTIQINGNAPIPLINPLWTNSTPYVMYPLVQSSPASQVLPAFCGLAYYIGDWNGVAGGFRGGVGSYLSSSSAGAEAYFPFEGLPPSATYQLAMTWVASNNLSKTVQVLIQDVNGNTLSSVMVDQTVAPADFTAESQYSGSQVGWKIIGTVSTSVFNNGITVVITTNGSTAPVLADAVMLSRTSADVSVVIQPSDVVTFSIPAGFFTTASGTVPAITNLAITNNAGINTNPIVPFSAVSKTLKVGYNVECETPYNPIFSYANLAHRLGLMGVQRDVNGYPTIINGSMISGAPILFSTTPPGEYTPGTGCYPNAPSGLYTLMWDGTCDVQFHPFSGQTLVSSNITKTTDNTRVYNVQPLANQYASSIYLDIYGTKPNPADSTGATYLCDLQNLRIFPPGIDVNNPPKFHPNYLTMLEGVQCLRFMDQMGTNNGVVADYADIKTSSFLGYGTGIRLLNAPIVSVTNYNGSDIFFDNQYYLVAEITTSVPHTLKDGMQATTSQPISFVTSTGDNPTTNLYGFVRVISPTVLLMGLDRQFTPATRSILSASFPAGTAITQNVAIGTNSPLADMVELCNTVGCDMWLNIPVAATPDCITQMGAYVAANLAGGRKVHVEWGNEAWNYGFATFQLCCSYGSGQFGVQDYNNYYPGFVYMTGTAHNLFAAQMAAAGRAGDMIRTYGTFGGSAGNTATICSQAASQGFTVDEVATAPYFDNYEGVEPSLIPITDLMTSDQDLDLMELNMEYDGLIATTITQHYAALAMSPFPNAKVWCYEGGPDSFIAFQSNTNWNVRNHHAIRNTRAYEIMLRYLQKLQDAGCGGINIFYLGAPTIGTLYNNQNEQFLWSTYTAWNQQPGTGDPTIDTVNNSNPDAIDQIKSEVGGAISRWNSLVASTPIPTKPKRSVPGRNGLIKATGYPRGLFRPVR